MDDGTLPYIEFGRSTYVPDSIKPHMSIDLLSGGTWSKVRLESLKSVKS
jgi:hypothetical protein